MRSAIARFLLSHCLIGLVAVGSSAQNLVQNPNFAGVSLPGWNAGGPNPVAQWNSLDATGDGSGSARIIGTNVGCSSPLYQTLSIIGGATYTLSGKINLAAGCTNCSAFIGVLWSDGSLSKKSLTAQSNGFQNVTQLITAPDGVNSGLYVAAVCAPTGTITAYFDDVSLTLESGPSAISVVPSAPGSNEVITLTVTGYAGCYVPSFQQVNISGTTITIEGAVTKSDCSISYFAPCPVKPYTFSTTVSPRPAGNYTADYFATDCLNTRTKQASTSFTIGGPAPLASGIIPIPESLHSGESVHLVVGSSGATGAALDGFFGEESIPINGALDTFMSGTTTFTYRAQSGSATSSSSAKVTVFTENAPSLTLSASPSLITAGSKATLSWTTTGATTASFDNRIGKVNAAAGGLQVAPTTTTTYTLTARGPGGVRTRSRTVTVNNAQAARVTTAAGSGQAGWIDGSKTTARFNHPFAVAVAPRLQSSPGIGADDVSSYDLYALDSNHTIRKIDPEGNTTTYAGIPGRKGSANGFRTSATFDFSDYVGAIIANADGSLEVIDANGIQRHISTAGQVTNKLDSNGKPCTSCSRSILTGGFILLPDRTIYRSDAGTHTVTRISPTGSTLVFGQAGEAGFAGGTPNQARFNRPRGLTIDTSGNVFVLDTGNNAIRKISPQNMVSTLTVSNSNGSGELTLGCCEGGIAPAPGGGVYVVDSGSNTVKQIASDGTVTTVAGSGSGGSTNGDGAASSFDAPLGLATAPDGTIIVTDTNNNTIRTIEPPPPAGRRRVARH